MLSKPSWVWRIAKWTNEWINQSKRVYYSDQSKGVKTSWNHLEIRSQTDVDENAINMKILRFSTGSYETKKDFPRRARTETPHADFAENTIAWKVETSPKRAYQGPGIWLIRTAILGFNWTWLLAKTCLHNGCLGMPASELWNARIHGAQNVEGCWGFPYLELQKLPKFHFTFLIDMKFIYNILKNCWRESSSSSGARLRLFNFSNFHK